MCDSVRRNGLALLVFLIVIGGCATSPYKYGGDYHTAHDVGIKPGESQIERGQPRPIIDTVGWIFGIPAKVVMLDLRMDNHRISLKTEAELQEYLAKNNLDKVKVRINEYDPSDEWRRLTENESICGPVRYTFGTLYVTGYTLFPGRIWGGDSYDPFTNTINICSDIPSLAMYEGGCAKFHAEREYKGWFAIVGGGLFRSIKASNDTLSYIQENGNANELKDGYSTLYPVVVTSTATPVAKVFAPTYVLPAWIAGHVTGQAKAATINENNLAKNRGQGRGVAPDLLPRVMPASYEGNLQPNDGTQSVVISPEVIRLPPVNE